MTAVSATISPDGLTVTLTQDKWSTSFPKAALPRWVDLYQGLRDREGGRFAHFYAASALALEQFQKKLKDSGNA